jgi:hypothetical protein
MAQIIFLRNIDGHEYFESFLISAVAAILSIRAFLHLTGYPTVGGGALHIAHMLWGGLLMAAALLLLLGFLGRQIKAFAAIVGGVGFGTFIDELGKFLTHDNDYFFEPTVALIYVIFIIMYVIMAVVRRSPPTPEESVANALELTLEAVRRDLDAAERERAQDLLRQAAPDDPVGAALQDALRRSESLVEPTPGPFARSVRLVRATYGRAVRMRWFAHAVIAFFIAHSVVMLVQTMVLTGALAGLALLALVALLSIAFIIVRAQPDGADIRGAPGVAIVAIVIAAAAGAGFLVVRHIPPLSLFAWGELVFSIVPAALVLFGIVRMPRSRLAAYRLFHAAVLLLIFVTQFFAFYHDQFTAVIGLFVNILVLATLRYMIHEEARLERQVVV